MTIKEIEAYVDAVMAMAKKGGEPQPHERVSIIMHALTICGRPDPERNWNPNPRQPIDAPYIKESKLG